jgi:DNA helicase HerA-like ATPase
MVSSQDVVGIILSGSTTTEATCQLLEYAERGGIKEGMLLLVKSQERKLLARVAQIIPYNAFYTEGDPWSEARRKGLPIPEDVARRYEICKLDLLIEIPTRSEIRSPPQPGDFVLRIDPKEHQKEIFGVSEEDPKHVWIGTLSGYEESFLPIPLNVENIPMHIAIFGVTGSGKSFTTGALIEKLSEIPVKKETKVSYPMIVIDAHGDYTDYANYVGGGGKLGCVKWVKRYVFPRVLSQLYIRTVGNVHPIGINLDLIPLRELAEIIILFYKGSLEGAELQVDGLETLFNYMEDEGYPSRQDLFTKYFKELKSKLEELVEAKIIHSSTKGAISRALESFKAINDVHNLLSVKSDLKEVDFIDRITREGGLAIFDFSADGAPGVDLKTKQFVMTYLATLLFEQFTQYKVKKEDRYLLFIIEEAQNFCPDKSYPISSSLAHAKLSAIATQGRKFGLSLCLISQRPSFVDRIVLSMCNTFFIHRVSPEDVNFVRSISGGLPPSLVPRLTTMSTGDVIITGQMVTVPFPLVVHILESDRKVKPTIGKTNVCERLAELRGV